MDIAYRLLQRSLENHEADYVFITTDDDGWRIETWIHADEKFVNVYGIPDNIRIKTILTFLPHDGITFKSNIEEVNRVIKEMELDGTQR